MGNDTSRSTEDLQKSAAKHPRWSLKKKLLVASPILLIVIALAVGLGVGLTRNRDNSSDDSGDDGSGNDDDSPSSGGNSTTPDNPQDLKRSEKWQPKSGTTWQIILENPITLAAAKNPVPAVEAYDLDMWDNTANAFKALHTNGQKVICYFSAGSYENWRPDKDKFHQSDYGKQLDGWPGEYWLNLSSPNVRNIMAARIKLAASKGCDAIDPDNVDGYQNDNGLGLTEADSVDYIKFLANEASTYNMSTGLKNAGDIIPSVLSSVAFSVNEQCVEYKECETFAPFVKAGKPVFNIEYPKGAPKGVADSKRQEICSSTGSAQGAQGFSHVIKDMDLDGWVEYCDGKQYTTATEDVSS